MYKLISPQSIYQYFGDDDPELIRDMITIILETSIQDLRELSTLYEQSDFVVIKKRCHKAKPSMSYIGAISSRKILEQIESDVEDSANLNLELQENLNGIEIELKDFLQNL